MLTSYRHLNWSLVHTEHPDVREHLPSKAVDLKKRRDGRVQATSSSLEEQGETFETSWLPDYSSSDNLAAKASKIRLEFPFSSVWNVHGPRNLGSQTKGDKELLIPRMESGNWSLVLEFSRWELVSLHWRVEFVFHNILTFKNWTMEPMPQDSCRSKRPVQWKCGVNTSVYSASPSLTLVEGKVERQ